MTGIIQYIYTKYKTTSARDVFDTIENIGTCVVDILFGVFFIIAVLASVAVGIFVLFF